MPKCDFSKSANQFYWNYTLAWVFSYKFTAPFQNTFSYERLWTAVSASCNKFFVFQNLKIHIMERKGHDFTLPLFNKTEFIWPICSHLRTECEKTLIRWNTVSLPFPGVITTAHHTKLLFKTHRNTLLNILISNPIDTGRKLNVHKTFRGCPGRLLNVLCTFNLRPVSTGKACENGMFTETYE